MFAPSDGGVLMNEYKKKTNEKTKTNKRYIKR